MVGQNAAAITRGNEGVRRRPGAPAQRELAFRSNEPIGALRARRRANPCSIEPCVHIEVAARLHRFARHTLTSAEACDMINEKRVHFPDH
jgi:hypothetical protein